MTGVALGGGEEISARDVLTTISARPLAALLPEDALPHRLLRRLRIWRYGTAAFKLDYALRAPVPWSAPEARAVTLTGTGKGFCSGGDVEGIIAELFAKDARGLLEFTRVTGALIQSIRELRRPVIAAASLADKVPV